jgi:hypothetical protein
MGAACLIGMEACVGAHRLGAVQRIEASLRSED